MAGYQKDGDSRNACGRHRVDLITTWVLSETNMIIQRNPAGCAPF